MSTVLIVDDQTTSRRILSEVVQRIDEGAQVVDFANPLDALEWADGQQPDLAFTDFKMPQIDGVEFTRRFRALSHCADIPLVVVTVVEDRNVRYQALEAGANDFLNKPIDQLEVRARCRNLLTLRHQQRIIRDRAEWLEQQVAAATAEIRTREYDTLLRLAKAGEYRDSATGNHVLRMAHYSRIIAERLGLPAAECEVIERSAPLHDIGKIGIPDRILLKPGQLTEEEWAVMQTHTLIGFEILKGSPSEFLQAGALVALNHHEHFDGSGYPNGLAGERIPMEARIVAVADTFDALTAVRPYKEGWSNEEIFAYLRGQAGRQFDPRCVAAFLEDPAAVEEIQQRLADRSETDAPL